MSGFGKLKLLDLFYNDFLALMFMNLPRDPLSNPVN